MQPTGLRLLLGVLAFYHLMIGVLSAFWPERAARVANMLYAWKAEPDQALGYAVRMLGLYALVFGYLLALAAWQPAAHKEVIVACIALLLLRAAWRLAFRRQLMAALKVSAQRNVINAVLLVVEAGLLILWFPA